MGKAILAAGFIALVAIIALIYYGYTILNNDAKADDNFSLMPDDALDDIVNGADDSRGVNDSDEGEETKKPQQDDIGIIDDNNEDKDTDGDGITDSKERELGTSPTKSNTDGDRYHDAEDPDPAVVNSAKVTAQLVPVQIKQDFEFPSLSDSEQNEVVVFTANLEAVLENSGNDYTSFVAFDVVIKLDGERVLSSPERLSARLDAGQTMSKNLRYIILWSELPEDIRTAINENLEQNGKAPTISYDLRNMHYEMFS